MSIYDKIILAITIMLVIGSIAFFIKEVRDCVIEKRAEDKDKMIKGQ